MRDSVIATNAVGDSCKLTLVLKRNVDILSIIYGISIYK